MAYELTNSENTITHINPDARLIRSVLENLPKGGFAILINKDTEDFTQVLNQSRIDEQQVFSVEYMTMTKTKKGVKPSWQYILDDGMLIDDVVVFFGEYMDGSERYKQYPYSRHKYGGLSIRSIWAYIVYGIIALYLLSVILEKVLDFILSIL